LNIFTLKNNRYAGALLARTLENDARTGKIIVIVVERRDAVHHKIGAIRASVKAGEWTERARIPLNRVIKHAKTVIADVVAVDEEEKTLKFRDDSQPPLHWDILIAATGTLNHSPGDLPSHLSGKDEVRSYFRATSKAIEEAKDIVIVGGGASAAEYAGEIRDAVSSQRSISNARKRLTVHRQSNSILRNQSQFYVQVPTCLVRPLLPCHPSS
jgi:NADH dehydrogenase FAD-containing subunit